jgi:two-component system chemotaxis response regulator CheY
MLKILIIDDSKAVHAFIKDCFSSTSHSLNHVYDGDQGVKVLALPGNQFDLILMDWEMPVLNGPDAFAEFKKMGVQVPVIMMTTRNAMADIQRMVNAGVSDYMMKPFTKEILFDKIESVLGRSVKDAA